MNETKVRIETKVTEPKDLPEWLKVGCLLYTSCNAEYWGPVTRIGRDGNGRAAIDFELEPEQVNAFLQVDTPSAPFGPYNLSRLELVAPGPETVYMMRDVPVAGFYDDDEGLKKWHTLILDTPGNGCFRCTKLFRVLPQ